MFETIKKFFQSIGFAVSALEKEAEKLEIESLKRLNDYIESQGGIEEVEKTKRQALEFMKRTR